MEFQNDNTMNYYPFREREADTFTNAWYMQVLT